MGVLLGAIADDFTGATDLCNTLVRRGMRTVQLIGVPAESAPPPDAEAVVVALKSRTIPAAEAVATSLGALAWLRRAGARQILFKYCSTFDSTDQGNIGPVAEALLDALGSDFTVFCPAFPENGRTIFKGYLFVGDVLLSESGMRDHPLTPMRDPSLVRVLQRQTTGQVGLVQHATVARGPAAIRAAFDALRAGGIRHAIVDAIADARSRGDRRGGGRSAADHRRLGDRAGLAGKFPPPGPARRRRAAPMRCRAVEGAAAVLSGSCSEATQSAGCLYRANARRYSRSTRSRRPRARMSRRRRSTGRHRCSASVRCWSRPPRRPRSRRRAAASRARARRGAGRGDHGAGRVAASSSAACGGSSWPAARPSGAVVQALGVTGLRIGRQIDPGVPWTVEPRRADAGAGAQVGQFRRRPISFCAPLTCWSGAAS